MGIAALISLGCRGEPEPVVLLAEFRHREDVAVPELVAGGPVDCVVDLLLGHAVFIDQEACGVAPFLRDGGRPAAVGDDPVGEVLAQAADVVAWRFRRSWF